MTLFDIDVTLTDRAITWPEAAVLIAMLLFVGVLAYLLLKDS